MMPDGKINLASLRNVMQMEMLMGITSNFDFVRTFMTLNFRLLQATDLNVTYHCCLPVKNVSYTSICLLVTLRQ